MSMDTSYDNEAPNGKEANMKFSEYDTVIILRDCKKDVKRGDIGTILMVFKEPTEAYEVEIVDEKGATKAQCTLLPDDLEPMPIEGML